MSAIYNFSIEQNSDFNRTLTVKDSSNTPVNLTGKAVSLIAKQTSGNTVIDLSVGTGITVDAPNGKITIALADTITDAYNFNTLKYVLKVGQSIILKGSISLIKEWA